MFFKKSDESKLQPKYKATYKSLYSGDIQEINIIKPTSALAYALRQNEDIWEMYILVCVTPLDKSEQ